MSDLLKARTVEITERVTHMPGIAKPGSSWDDVVMYQRYVTDDGEIKEWESRQALVTAEFMENADDALEHVRNLLAERA